MQAELIRPYSTIFNIDPHWDGNFDQARTAREKGQDFLGQILLGEEPAMIFKQILDELQEKANGEYADRIYKGIWLNTHNLDDLTRDHLTYSRYSGTPLTSAVSKIDFFPDIDGASIPDDLPIPTASLCEPLAIFSFTELQDFQSKYFQTIEITFDPHKELPPEIGWLVKHHPEAKDHIDTLIRNGMTVKLQKTISTPDAVLTAIRQISTLTQHNWTINWLPDLVQLGKIPELTFTKPMDHAETTDMLDTSKEFLIQTARNLLSSPDFLYQSSNLIKLFADETLRISITSKSGEPISDEFLQMTDALNCALAPLRQDYAGKKLQFDYSHERTDLARKIFKTLIVFGTATHVVEKFLELPRIAKVIAGSADDLMGEMGEIQALLAQGFTIDQIVLKRLKWLLPTAIVAGYMSYQMVEDLLRTGDPALAGLVFGVSAVLLSSVTAIQSMGMFKGNLDLLIQEGKATDRSTLARWAKAFEQDFNNPLRAGILIGVIISPLLAYFAGRLGLFNIPFLLPIVGQAESYGGALSSVGSQIIFDINWRNRCRK